MQKHFAEIYYSLDFGAYVEPQQYFVSYIFKTDAELESAKKSGLLAEINQYHKKCLADIGYPVSAISDCVFAAQEDCNRNYDGNWYFYYK